jgi:spectinomycin phosphotransferase
MLFADLDDYKLILYPYVEGKDGYEAALSDRQWLAFGAALKAIHRSQPPPGLSRRIPQENFSPHWREMVIAFQSQVEEMQYSDPVAVKLAAFMWEKREDIALLVDRADELASTLAARCLPTVLCHADMHAGNLLLGANEALYIVDWDNPLFAPKEKDLALIGGCAAWSDAWNVALFYQGYGAVEIDPPALSYYRCERIIQDIAAFCQQLLLSDEGGDDREQGYRYFTSSFLPGHEVELVLDRGWLNRYTFGRLN